MLKIFVPFALAKNIYEIDIDFFVKLGIKNVICDLDNTLAAYYEKEPSARTKELVENFKEKGINFIIISNNTKERVSKYTKKLACDYIYSARKPFRKRSRNYFKKNNIDLKDSIYIGDQVFTDVVFSNRIGLRCILCDNLVKKDQFFTKINKFFDKSFRNKIVKNGLSKSRRNI